MVRFARFVAYQETPERLLPAALIPAIGTPLLLAKFPADFLGVLVGGYLASVAGPVIVMIVLLKEACTCAIASCTCFRTFFRVVVFLA